MAAVMVCLYSCGGANYAEINERIEKGEALTESDYTAMVDYMIDGQQAVIKVLKSTEGTGTERLNNAQEKLKELEAKYPYMETFQRVLMRANESEIGEKNVERMKQSIEDMLKAMTE